MRRRTKGSLAVLAVALFAVAGGLWRQHQPAAPAKVAQSSYRILTSGVVEAAATHHALIAEAQGIPKEIATAQAQSLASHAPPILTPVAPTPPPGPEPTPAEVPPSQQVLIGFSGGEIGETDPCG